MSRRIFTIIVIITTILSTFSVFAYDEPYYQVVVDGVYVPWKDGRPYIDANNRLMVPVRAAAEIIGADVEWDNTMQTAFITRHIAYSGDCPEEYRREGTFATEITVGFTLGSKNYTVTAPSIGMREVETMDTIAVIKNSRIYVPIRYLAEPLGYAVSWDADTATLRGENPRDFVDGALSYTMDERPLDAMFLKMTNDMVKCNVDTAILNVPYKISFSDIDSAFDAAFSQFRYEHLEESCYAPSRYYKASSTSKATTITLTFRNFRDSKREIAFDLAARYLTELYEDGVITRDMTQTERATKIAEAFHGQMEYETIDEFSYTAWAAFTRGKANCQGYTSAYNTLLELDGIETFCIDGYNTNAVDEEHCWTKAVLDGKEMYFDTTWGPNYFLLSETSMYATGYREN